MFYYSKSSEGFYFKGVHKILPDDCVEISKEYHFILLQGQAAGKQIISDAAGYPVLLDTDTRPAQERSWRDAELFRADFELNKVQDGMGVGSVSSWREYRCKLRNWPQNENFPNKIYRPVSPDSEI